MHLLDLPYSRLPADSVTIKRYIGWQGKKGTVLGSSMTQYLSAIIFFHRSIELPAPCPTDAKGHYAADVRNAIVGMTKCGGAGVSRAGSYLSAGRADRRNFGCDARHTAGFRLY